MPFTTNMLITQEAGRWQLIRIYYEPQQEDAPAFAKALREVVDRARRSALTNQQFYKEGLPKGISLRIVHRKEDQLTAAQEEVLRKEGFSQDGSGWSQIFPLSWELDAGYRALQEELERRIDQGAPYSSHDEQTSVAAHNMGVLMEVARATLGLALDGSLESINRLDELLVMEQVEPEWRFRVFSPATVIACGDYAGEVAVRTFPELRWSGDQSYELEFVGSGKPGTSGGGQTSTRNKAIKRCLYGQSDSLHQLLFVLVSMIRQGRL